MDFLYAEATCQYIDITRKGLSEDGNPSFATVMRITRALGMHLRITV